MQTKETFASALGPVRQQLESWRQTRTRPGPLPPPLWQAAVELARVHGINPVAQALNLDYNCLKRRVQAGISDRGVAAATPAFVEVQLPPSAQALECTVQLEDRRGTKMNVHLVGGGAAEVAALAQSLWRRES